jgi:uncharacterized membrane protein
MSFRSWVEGSAQAIEMLAVALIVVVIAVATMHYVAAYLRRRGEAPRAYEDYRRRVGRALLLTLEILVAADIVRTVALENTLRSIAGLALLVLVRTFLSWSLMLELEGHWPWQRRAPAHAALHEVDEAPRSDADRTVERAA